jgi:hypothetical protein
MKNDLSSVMQDPKYIQQSTVRLLNNNIVKLPKGVIQRNIENPFNQ